MDKYVENLRILSYETDCRKQLRPTAFMKQAQEMAMVAAEPIGLGYDAMMEHGASWVLSRLHFKFEQAPVWRQSVVFRSWHRGIEGLMFRREFHMTDEQENTLVTGTSQWVILNVAERRVMRPNAIADIIPAEPQSEDVAEESPAPKVVIPKSVEMAHVRTHKVNWSDIDFIGHTNNVQYLEWALDSLDTDFVAQHPVKEVAINFVRETHLDQEVDIHVGTDGEGNYYVAGYFDGNVQSFITKITF